MTSFWDRFTYLCSLKGMKPNPVAENVGKSSGAVTKWKNGSIPDSNTLIALAGFFECSTDYLIGRTDTPAIGGSGLTPDEQAIVAAFKNLSPKERWELIGRARQMAEQHQKDFDQDA